MDSDQQIWVLGARNSNAHRDIPWEAKEFPNLSDPDVLIIDLGSLNGGLLRNLDKEKCETIVNEISNKFVNGGTIIYLTALKILEQDASLSKTPYKSKVKLLSPRFSNYFFSIINLEPQAVAEGRVIKYDRQKHLFTPYLDKVKKFQFYLCYNSQKSEHTVNFRTNSDTLRLTILNEYSVKDNSNHDLALALQCERDDGNSGGKIIYLPPPTDVSVEEAIDIILNIYGKFTLHETLPDWISRVHLYGLDQIKTSFSELNARKHSLEQEIKTLEISRHNLMKYYRLLFSDGNSLENAVCDAFRTLGFEEIRKVREENKEDWILEFRTLQDFKYAVIEVKGSRTRTSQRDISQCDKWVSEYFGERQEFVKGIFIPNQHRLNEYSSSRGDRLHFEPAEVQFCEMRNICIIPSCVLFEAVNKALERRQPREDLEKLIAFHKGVLTEINSPTY
jgi:hypothetical protein